MNNIDWESGRSFAERFKRYIESKGFRQKDLCKQMHTNQSHISRLTTGQDTPSYNDILQMMALWGRDITTRLLFDIRETRCGITWIEPWPVFSPGVPLDETTDSLRAFREYMPERPPADGDGKPSTGLLSQQTLLNKIKQCFLSGIVQIQDVERNRVLEQRLKDKFSLAECIVSNITLPSNAIADTVIRAEAVAFLAAKDALYSILRSQHVGITGGSPIYRFIDLLLPATTQLKGVHWWSLLSTYDLVTGGAPAGTGANDTIARLAYTQPGAICRSLPFVHAHQRDLHYRSQTVATEREAIRYAETCLQGAGQVETAFISVGSPDFEFRQLDVTLRTPALRDVYENLSQKQRESCVGDILLRAVDADGNILGSPEMYDRFVYSVSHDDLRQIVGRGGLVWILAERPGKAAVVRAALKSGIANALVIDRLIAIKLIESETDQEDLQA